MIIAFFQQLTMMVNNEEQLPSIKALYVCEVSTSRYEVTRLQNKEVQKTANYV